MFLEFSNFMTKVKRHLKDRGFFPYANRCFSAQSKNPRDSRAKVSTLITYYNHWEYTKKAVESYYQSLDDKYAYSLILLDDCSSDRSGKFVKKQLRHYKNYSYIRFKKNRGLTRSWNYGVDYALRKLKADYIVIANDDILISKGAIGRLMDGLRAAPGGAIIGPLTNGPGMHEQNQDIRKHLSDYIPDDRAEAIEQTSRRVLSKPVSEVNQINGFFWAGHSKVFLKNFLTRFGFLKYYFCPDKVNLGNELDFQSRLEKNLPGVKILLAANVFIFHYKDVSQERAKRGLIKKHKIFRPQQPVEGAP